MNELSKALAAKQKLPSETQCPCCLELGKLVVAAAYTEYICDGCRHTWFVSPHAAVDQKNYENSEKYDEYYVGKPPFLWYHKKSLEYLLRNAPEARILDFGCFDGFFTKRLVSSGLNAFGCDWNRRAIEYGRVEFGLDERLKRDPEGLYDVIVALEVIEHFEDPNVFFDIVLPHLSRSGTIVLSCPNKDSVYRPKTDAPPHHFSRFSNESLATLSERRGFVIEIHNNEMSSFQLMRNILGDVIRSDVPLLGKNSEPSDKANTRRLKYAANQVSGLASLALKLIDIPLHAFGFSYLSQFIVIRKKQ